MQLTALSPANAGGLVSTMYNSNSMIDNNPYIITCCDSDGCTPRDVRREMKNNVPKKRKFPLTMFGVTFKNKREYEDALHDFLNGN